MNTPIKILIDNYSKECCDFSDIDWVIKASLRNVETMPDSFVRCLLYTLASKESDRQDKDVHASHPNLQSS